MATDEEKQRATETADRLAREQLERASEGQAKIIEDSSRQRESQ